MVNGERVMSHVTTVTHIQFAFSVVLSCDAQDLGNILISGIGYAFYKNITFHR